MEQFQFHYSVAYSAPGECKNLGIIGNLKRIINSFLGNKRIEYVIGDVSGIIYQGLMTCECSA